jgi:hypothetical protein
MNTHELREYTKARAKMRDIIAVAPQDLIAIVYETGEKPRGLAKDSWVVDIRHGRPRPPGQVKAIKNNGGLLTIWVALARPATRVNQRELAELVPNWEEEPKITDAKTLRKILSLYSI